MTGMYTDGIYLALIRHSSIVQVAMDIQSIVVELKPFWMKLCRLSEWVSMMIQCQNDYIKRLIVPADWNLLTSSCCYCICAQTTQRQGVSPVKYLPRNLENAS